MQSEHVMALHGGGFSSSVMSSNEHQAKVSVMSFLFDNNASAFQKDVSAFCVKDMSVRDHEADNSSRLALLMKKANPKVVSYMLCQINKDSSVSFSGRRAIEFVITEVSKISDEEYLVDAGYYEGNLSSQTNQYRARKNGNSWAVTLEGMGAVS